MFRISYFRKQPKFRRSLILFLSLLITEPAFAKSGIVITEEEVIIDVSKGTPTLKAKIGTETYNFMITPSDPALIISPEIAAKHNLDATASKGFDLILDYALYTTKKNKLEIEFVGLETEKEKGKKKKRNDENLAGYDVYWLHEKPYEGLDGSVGLHVFGNRKITYIFDDTIPTGSLDEKSHYNNSTQQTVWRRNLKRFAGKTSMQVAFRPHYDISRMTIGASYAFDKDDNLSYPGESYYMPREFRGYEEFVLGNFKTPISPLKGIKSLSQAEVHVIAGSLDAIVKRHDDVVATGKSTRVYTPILWLGRDYFDGCHRLEITRSGKKLTTFCPTDYVEATAETK